MLLVFIGPPGAGKGTQSKRLCERYQISHLSTGDILRKAKANGTELGKKVGPIMDSGGLVNDELMVQVVDEAINRPDCRAGFLLDGFPRSIPQAEALDELLSRRRQRLTAVIELKVPRAELERRLVGRYYELTDPRPEDQPDAIGHRLDLYERITAPLLEYYTDKRLLLSIDGVGSTDEVFSRITGGLPSTHR